ncbi:MAG: methionine--tRNA ligase subunit beta [Planctomycetes bacterium]|nr:methionine--tRNA ligase subunit beta [Planctomycetota bacterium]
MSESPQPPAPTPVPPAAEPVPAGVVEIGIDDFAKVRLATAEVVEASAHPKADRLLILQLKLGERSKRIVSGIREHYSPEQLIGKTIVIVDNLKPTKLRGEVSEGMLLAVRQPDGGLRLVTTDGPSASGLEIS